MINNLDGFSGRATSGGPEGFNCFGVVEMEIPYSIFSILYIQYTEVDQTWVNGRATKESRLVQTR